MVSLRALSDTLFIENTPLTTRYYVELGDAGVLNYTADAKGIQLMFFIRLDKGFPEVRQSSVFRTGHHRQDVEVPQDLIEKVVALYESEGRPALEDKHNPLREAAEVALINLGSVRPRNQYSHGDISDPISLLEGAIYSFEKAFEGIDRYRDRVKNLYVAVAELHRIVLPQLNPQPANES